MSAIMPMAVRMNLFQVKYEIAVYGVINLISDIKYRTVFLSAQKKKKKNDKLA